MLKTINSWESHKCQEEQQESSYVDVVSSTSGIIAMETLQAQEELVHTVN